MLIVESCMLDVKPRREPRRGVERAVQCHDRLLPSVATGLAAVFHVERDTVDVRFEAERTVEPSAIDVQS